MTNSPTQLLADTAAAWGLPLDAHQLAQLDSYAAELLAWNTHTNLTAIKAPEEVYVRHFLDSLALARHWGAAPESLVDIGTGAGFPGLPLKSLRPEIELILLDSVGKKTAFLRHVVEQLGLTNVRIITGRAEDLGRDPHERERHSVVTARAVGALSVLAEYGLPLLRIGGLLLAPKGATAQEEIAAAKQAIQTLGGAIVGVEPVALPGVEPRTLVIIKKMASTSRRFPRAVGLPARNPL